MHAAFCSDGDDMCGGLFEHTLSDSQVISDFIKHVTSEAVVEATAHGNSAALPLDVEATGSLSPAPQATSRPARKATGKRRKKAAGTQKKKMMPVETADTDVQVCSEVPLPFSHSFLYIRAQRKKSHLSSNKILIRRRMRRTVDHHAGQGLSKHLGSSGRLHHRPSRPRMISTTHLHRNGPSHLRSRYVLHCNALCHTERCMCPEDASTTVDNSRA